MIKEPVWRLNSNREQFTTTMAGDKKRLKGGKQTVVPIVQTVLEELSYSASTSSINQSVLQNGGGAGNIINDENNKKSVKTRGRSPKEKPITSMRTSVGAITQPTSGENVLNNRQTTQTRGRPTDKSKDIKSGAYSSTVGDKREYFDDEAEEGDEDEENEEDEEEDEHENYDEDEKNEGVDRGDQNQQTQFFGADGDDENYAAEHYEDHHKETKGYSNSLQDESNYAIVDDHNITSNSTVRPSIGKVVVSNEFYKKLAHQKPSSSQSGSMYAQSFNAPKNSQTSTMSSGSGSGTSASAAPNLVRQSSTFGSNESSVSNANSRISTSGNIHSTLIVNGQGSITSSPLGAGNTTFQIGSLSNRSFSNQKLNQSSPLQMSQQSHVYTSSPSSITSVNGPLRPKLIANYTVAMNALDSVTPELQSKVGFEQANTAIIEVLNDTTRYYKAVYMGEAPALNPPTTSKEFFADSILKSGNLLGEYKVTFREYEAATTSQSLASAQLKHALAHKQHVESKLLHIKNRLQQLQFDASK